MEGQTSAGSYPAHRETNAVLRNGSTVHIRPARPTDQEALEDYFLALSPESRRLRFGGQSIDVREVARNSVHIDYVDHLTLLALVEDRVVGGAQYIKMGKTTRAEVGVSVEDDMQGAGLGSILIGHLAQAAADVGIKIFHADVLPDNHRMIDVFRQSGFLVSIRAKPGIVEVEFPTVISEETIGHYEEREGVAAANAIRVFLEPTKVAVIGASRDRESIGGRLLHNLLAQPFSGVVYPVNPKTEAVQGIRAYPSIVDVPDVVEVAFVVVPALGVLDVAQECGRKGVKALVVISAGFGELGPDGRERQEELLGICRESGMRLVGPNCMGVVNTDPDLRLNGTFASVWPPAGRLGFLSQSGALGLAVMRQAASLGLGLSTFVSIGNTADVSASDLLAYWDQDPRTEVVLLYLESFGNPRRFARLARRICRTKPIVAVKSGRSSAGVRATVSHTGALLAASDTTVDALFHQVGVIRTDTLEEMFEVATLLANQPVPTGNRVGIVTNAGGLGIQCADTCEAHGLEVPELAPDTVKALHAFLPPEASVGNPVDMIASASGEDYASAIAAVGADPGIDAMIVIYIPPLEANAPEIARHMLDAFRGLERKIPVLTTFMSARGLPEELRAPGLGIPSFAYPEQAAIALARAVEYGLWRSKPRGTVFDLAGLRQDEAAAVIAGALERGEGWMTQGEVRRLLECYGLPVARTETAVTPELAEEIAAVFAGPVALKAVGPVHKTEAGGVLLNVLPGDVRPAAEAMAARLSEHRVSCEGFTVQEMVSGGVEMLVGVVSDGVFGPVVAVGAGGVTVELIRDVAVRIAPLTDVDADEMVRELATFPLLDGFRGAPKMDVQALTDVLLRVSALADRHPELVEMDCNPVMVLPKGARIVDARIKIRMPEPQLPFASRASR